MLRFGPAATYKPLAAAATPRGPALGTSLVDAIPPTPKGYEPRDQHPAEDQC